MIFSTRVLFAPLLLGLALSGCIGIDEVDDPVIAERLRITPRVDTIEIGQQIQFSAVYTDRLGQPEDRAVVWSTSNASYVSVTPTGLAEGVAAGPVYLIATSGVLVDSLFLNDGISGPITRSGTFTNLPNGYTTLGNVSLVSDGGTLKVKFASNAMISSGPSLYLLLTNSTSPPFSVINGGNAINAVSAQVTSTNTSGVSGITEFTVPSGVAIDDYDYVIFYCTLGPVFGYAQLN